MVFNWAKEAAEKIDRELAEQQNAPEPEAQAPEPQPQLEPQPQPQPDLTLVSPAPQPLPQPDIAAQIEAERIAARAEAAELKAQLEAERQARQTEATRLRELEEQERQRALDRELNLEGLEFNSLDPEDAQKLAQPLLKAIRAQQDKQAALLREQQEALQRQTKESREARDLEFQRQTNEALKQAVPDFDQLSKQPAFQAFLKQPIRPGSLLTYGEDLRRAYEQGRADYMAQSIQAWRSGRPDPADIAQISSTSAGAAPPTGEETPAGLLSDQALAELRKQVRTGFISRGDFSLALKKHEEALKKLPPRKE